MVRRLADLRRGLDQYEYLASVDAADARLFYATVLTHLTEIMPLIYTPVVGTLWGGLCKGGGGSRSKVRWWMTLVKWAWFSFSLPESVVCSPCAMPRHS